MDNDHIRNLPSVTNPFACVGPLLSRWNIYSLPDFNRNSKIAKTKVITARYGRYITNIVKRAGSHLRR